MIEVVDFHKTYRDLVAVEGLSFSVQPGEIMGMVGPNGAGVVISSHLLNLVEDLSTHLLMMNRVPLLFGRIVTVIRVAGFHYWRVVYVGCSVCLYGLGV